MERMLGHTSVSPEEYTGTVAPLRLSPDLEGRSGAMVDQERFAILPSPKLTDLAHAGAFLARSEELVAGAGLSLGQ
jgi:hypothetical protein